MEKYITIGQALEIIKQNKHISDKKRIDDYQDSENNCMVFLMNGIDRNNIFKVIAKNQNYVYRPSLLQEIKAFEHYNEPHFSHELSYVAHDIDKKRGIPRPGFNPVISDMLINYGIEVVDLARMLNTNGIQDLFRPYDCEFGCCGIGVYTRKKTEDETEYLYFDGFEICERKIKYLKGITAIEGKMEECLAYAPLRFEVKQIQECINSLKKESTSEQSLLLTSGMPPG